MQDEKMAHLQKLGAHFRSPLYSPAVLNLNSLLISSSSLSLFTFHRVKSNKSARHRQNKSHRPFAQELQATSFGRLLFAVHSFRSSIGGKRTRFSRTNSNTQCIAQTSFALFPMLERLFTLV